MTNPWDIFEPCAPMFCDRVTISGRRPGERVSADCAACVFPPATVETFSDEAEDTKILKQKILLSRVGELSCGLEPQTGDKIVTDVGDMYVANASVRHEWYDVEVRSKK